MGASAGGLEALENFLPAHAGRRGIWLSPSSSILSPDQPSALPQLLARYTQMPVEQVKNRTAVEPDHVCVLSRPIPRCPSVTARWNWRSPREPRGKRIASSTGSLVLLRGIRVPNAVCIMLSGTGTDGTRGLSAVKEYGGMALAQAPESARYDSILRSAISTGLVDHVLPVEQMPAKLIEYAAHLGSVNGKSENLREQVAGQLGKIHRLVKRHAGHDFSQYKDGTIGRRVERRMKALQMEETSY